MSAGFWARLDQLVECKPVRVDRPRGSAHPRYPDLVYPSDYGFLPGTRAADGAGLDVWMGTLPGRQVTAVVITVDSLKADAELKLLLGCTPAEARQILALHYSGSQAAVLIERPAAGASG